MNSDQPIPPDEYVVIAKHVPIVSVDLLVHHNGGLLLGKRQNKPAKNTWFVPGGTVIKGESRRQAAHRVAKEEIGSDIIIDEHLGVYDHMYETAEAESVESKQYLATAFVVTPVNNSFETDEQHTEFKVATPPIEDTHDYIHRYIMDLRSQGYSYR
mgnify:CR=1 FL=1